MQALHDEDVDSSDKMDGNEPKKAKITKPKPFNMIGTHIERNSSPTNVLHAELQMRSFTVLPHWQTVEYSEWL